MDVSERIFKGIFSSRSVYFKIGSSFGLPGRDSFRMG